LRDDDGLAARTVIVHQNGDNTACIQREEIRAALLPLLQIQQMKRMWETTLRQGDGGTPPVHRCPAVEADHRLLDMLRWIESDPAD
jgi:hypothetical protein